MPPSITQLNNVVGLPRLVPLMLANPLIIEVVPPRLIEVEPKDIELFVSLALAIQARKHLSLGKSISDFR